MDTIQSFPIEDWAQSHPTDLQQKATHLLESGHVLFFPNLNFQLKDDEHALLSPTTLEPKKKNVSYHSGTQQLAGTHLTHTKRAALQAFMQRYASVTQQLINTILPQYAAAIQSARTSFRPKEIQGRQTSLHKDDTRLHVDAFPANPVQNNRILRVFTNINPEAIPRVWRTGEPFIDVVTYFKPRLKKPIPGMASLLKSLSITKQKRTAYDHYMLQLHNLMKEDDLYQSQANQQTFAFPANSTWMVFTDQVSHAAMQGQYLLEQSFYLPIQHMEATQNAPIRILERLLQRKLDH